jgi:plasmid stabilization system protein ParE
MSRRYKVYLSERAQSDLEAAMLWWTENRDKAPEAMIEDVAEALERLAKHGPKLGTPVRSARVPGLRRLALPRVRQYVYFVVSLAGEIEVAALWHVSKAKPPVI